MSCLLEDLCLLEGSCLLEDLCLLADLSLLEDLSLFQDLSVARTSPPPKDCGFTQELLFHPTTKVSSKF